MCLRHCIYRRAVADQKHVEMKLIRRIISWIYTLVVIIRHRLYDWGVLKSYSFDIPIVCVGNITVGGTGKTPTAEYILASLANHYTMAILSRGYGRTTKGYREVTTDDIYSDVGDEPLQMKLKFPERAEELFTKAESMAGERYDSLVSRKQSFDK